MNTEDSAEARSIDDASSVGVAANTTALGHRLGVAATTVKAALNDDKSTASPVADIALRRMSRQLAGSMSKLVDEFNALLNQLVHAEAAHSLEHRDIAPMTSEAEQIRQQLIWGGYRLAAELRKATRAQQSSAAHRQPRSQVGQHLAKPRIGSAIVIDIQDILESVSGTFRETR